MGFDGRILLLSMELKRLAAIAATAMVIVLSIEQLIDEMMRIIGETATRMANR